MYLFLENKRLFRGFCFSVFFGLWGLTCDGSLPLAQLMLTWCHDRDQRKPLIHKRVHVHKSCTSIPGGFFVSRGWIFTDLNHTKRAEQLKKRRGKSFLNWHLLGIWFVPQEETWGSRWNYQMMQLYSKYLWLCGYLMTSCTLNYAVRFFQSKQNYTWTVHATVGQWWFVVGFIWLYRE